MYYLYKLKIYCYKYNNFLCKKKYYLYILFELLVECCVILIFYRYVGRIGYNMIFYVFRIVWCIYEIYGKDWFLCRGINILKFF